MKDKAFVEKGLGMLHLKKVEGDDTKTQMVVRAETNLGNILLNILVSDKMKVTVKKNNVQFMCVPNPPIKGMEGKLFVNFSKIFTPKFRHQSAICWLRKYLFWSEMFSI